MGDATMQLVPVARNRSTILERLDKQGVVPQAMTAEAFGELLRADYAKMARVVKISGARID